MKLNPLLLGAENIINGVASTGSSSMTFIISRIRWTKVPVEASGIYQCRDSNDVKQSTSNTTLSVSSKPLEIYSATIDF
jgi:hypothetical protein